MSQIPVLVVTAAEVLADLFPRAGEGTTTPEFAEMWECSNSTALRRIRKLVKDGNLLPTCVQRACITGRVQRVPAYVLAESPIKEK
jgi:predicted transcriptional regulator